MKIDPDSVPNSVAAAVEALVASLSAEDVEYILKSKEDTGHFSIGMAVRNAWSLWEKQSPIVQDAIKTYKIAHGDDVSGLIFAWAWARVRGEDFDPLAFVERYHEHWARSGKTSLEAADY